MGPIIEMDKVWRRSGKLFPRQSHLLADGRRVPVNESFDINGHKLRFPHDPKAPASETINCGCVCLYRPRSIKATLPDKRPFTKEEQAMNPDMAELAGGKAIAALQEEQFRKKLAKKATEIALAPLENLVVFSRDGEVLLGKIGEKYSIPVSIEEGRKMANAGVLHNHPDIPVSFSVEDIHLSVWNNPAELHLVNEHSYYRITRPTGTIWGPEYWQKTLLPVVECVTHAVELHLEKAVSEGPIAPVDKDLLIDHLVWSEVNEEIDLGYTMTRRVNN